MNTSVARIAIAPILALVANFTSAEEPSVTHYQSIKEEMTSDKFVYSELILKVNNPTDRTFYLLGHDITDIPYQVEVLKDDKWSVVPSRVCGTGMTVRAFLPHSSIVFTVTAAPLHDADTTFRIRVYLYTEPDIFSLYAQPNRKPWITFVSPAYRSNDFIQKGDNTFHPRLPGLDPSETPEALKPPPTPAAAVPPSK